MAKLIYTLVGDGDEANIVAFVGGLSSPLVAHSSHVGFRAIVDFCDKADAEGGDLSNEQVGQLVELFDTEKAVTTVFSQLSERVSAKDGKLYLDGDEIRGEVVEVILRSMSQGLKDFQPLVFFIERMAQNPNPASVDQLYAWIAAQDLTIDIDGMIVGYKGVIANGDGTFRSVNAGKAIVNGQELSGQITQQIGDIVEMPRSEVQFDPGVGCSTGLHVGTYDYASGWARGALLEVAVDPRDVVSVPTDCGAQKLRCCRYQIVGTIDKPYQSAVKDAEYAGLMYGDLWGDEFDPEDDEYDWLY